jgi:hypothetical protein
MFLRLNLGLEAHIIVMKTKQWRMILNGGTVPGNNVDPKKALLLRSFLVPKAFNNEFSRRSDQQRLINVFAAWEFCHKDGDTVLLVDWSRIVKMHLFRFQFSFQEDFLSPGHQVRLVYWISLVLMACCRYTHCSGATLMDQTLSENRWNIK